MSGKKPGPAKFLSDDELRDKVREVALTILAAGGAVTLARLRAGGAIGTWSRISRIRAEMVLCGELPPAAQGRYVRLHGEGNGCTAVRVEPVVIAMPAEEVDAAVAAEERKRNASQRLVRKFRAADRRISGIGDPGWLERSREIVMPLVEAERAKREKRKKQTGSGFFRRR